MKYFFLFFAFLGLITAITQFKSLRQEKEGDFESFESDSPLVNPLGTSYKSRLTVRVGLPIFACIVGIIVFLFAQ